MKLSELKTGMIVTTREGVEYVVFKDAVCKNPEYCGTVFVNKKCFSWHEIKNFKEDMTYESGWGGDYKKYDIVKVEIPSHPYSYMDLNYEEIKRKVIWEREEIKEVTMAEIEKKFGCKVKIVKEKANE